MNARTLSVLAGFALVMMLHAPAARADAIDGSWCHADGRHMAIEGPAIVIPTGKKIAGRYDRHAFDYVVPAGVRDTGTAVSMILVDDDTIHLTMGDAKEAVQVWRRCALPTS
jgi:hypothetical protein